MSRRINIKLLATPSPAIFLLFSAVFGATNAIPWTVAEKTATYKADEWSPRPTNTPPEPRDLFKRNSDDVDICGWIGGNLAQPVGCASGSSCVHDTLLQFVGCCPTSSQGAAAIPCTDGLYTTCIDSHSAGYSANSVLVNNGVLSCPASSSCYKISYPESYIQFGCGPSTADLTAATTFAGQATDVNLQIVYTGVSFDPAITIQSPSNFGAATSFKNDAATSSTASQSEATATNVAGKGSLTGAAPTSTSASSSSKGNSNTGAIAGGVVGGIVALIGAAVLAVFLIRRRDNKRESGVPRGGVSSPQRPSKETFEAIPNPTPSPQPQPSPMTFASPALQNQDSVSPESVANPQSYAPMYNSPYHRPTTPLALVEAPTPDMIPSRFRSPSPNPDPFEPPNSLILPESYDPNRRNHSRSPEPQFQPPYLSQSNNNSNNHSPAALNTVLPPTADLPPLDLMEDTKTPVATKPSNANWHLALTGDRRTYAPTDDDDQPMHHDEPMPALPAMYADLIKDINISNTSPPEESYLPRSNNSGKSSNGEARRNFSRKGRAKEEEEEESNEAIEQQYMEEPQAADPTIISSNIRSSGWSPAGLRTRTSPSPHSVPRFKDTSQGGGDVYGHGQGLSEEVQIAYNPGLGVQNAGAQGGYGGAGLGPRPMGSMRGGRGAPPGRTTPSPVPVVDPNVVEGGWL